MIRPKYRNFVLFFYCVCYLFLCLNCSFFTVFNVNLLICVRCLRSNAFLKSGVHWTPMVQFAWNFFGRQRVIFEFVLSLILLNSEVRNFGRIDMRRAKLILQTHIYVTKEVCSFYILPDQQWVNLLVSYILQKIFFYLWYLTNIYSRAP